MRLTKKNIMYVHESRNNGSLENLLIILWDNTPINIHMNKDGYFDYNKIPKTAIAFMRDKNTRYKVFDYHHTNNTDCVYSSTDYAILKDYILDRNSTTVNSDYILDYLYTSDFKSVACIEVNNKTQDIDVYAITNEYSKGFIANIYKKLVYQKRMKAIDTRKNRNNMRHLAVRINQIVNDVYNNMVFEDYRIEIYKELISGNYKEYLSDTIEFLNNAINDEDTDPTTRRDCFDLRYDIQQLAW